METRVAVSSPSTSLKGRTSPVRRSRPVPSAASSLLLWIFSLGSLGGGGHDPGEHLSSLPAHQISAEIQRVVEGKPATLISGSLQATGQFPDIVALRLEQGRSPITGRLPIPLPEQGGPGLVTERFQSLPPIFDAPELVAAPLGFEGVSMPVDVPLLSGFGSLLPAVRQVAQPTIQGVVGGLAGGFLSEFLRAPQETGLGQVPARQVAQVSGCPTEKPSTRILRFIKANTGVSIKLTRAKSLIRELGLENAARCLGINMSEACSLLIVASPRRRRGISASDIRIVRRTARRFENLKHDLGHLGGRTGHHHHRRRTHHKK